MGLYDEIDGGNLKVVSEGAYQIELMERRIDAYLDGDLNE